MASVSGTLIAESLLVDHPIDLPLRVRRISRADLGDESAGQPRRWTFIEFEIEDESVDVLADGLSGALDPRGAWYCDFRSPDETFVVLAGHVFRYSRGDLQGRARATAHGRSVGVPEAQLDWPE
jgi:hypothetical protein